MSWREHWEPVRSSVVKGDVISGCRDNESKTYRLFANKGWRDVKFGSTKAHQIDNACCCDLSFEDLRELHRVLGKAIAEHKPWPRLEDA